jgi:hypothetical protein
MCSRFDPVAAPVADEHEVACFIHHQPPGASGTRPSFAARQR